MTSAAPGSDAGRRTSRKRWVVAAPATSELPAWEGVHPVVRQILEGRGISSEADCRDFLYGDVEHGRPSHLADLDTAVARVHRALTAGESIAVYGDYDVDGIAGTALLTTGLRALGGRVRPYIPHRVEEGYGLNRQALETLAAEGSRLVITVDSGIASVDEIAHANAIGLDVVVCDHHTLPPVLPAAVAAINPKRPDSDYAFRDLCAAGVAFKLLQGVAEAAPDRSRFDPDAVVDLVALATVADMVPLVSENRSLVRQGLAVLRERPRPGIRALVEQAKIEVDKIDSRTIGFVIAPRLNAAGRLDTALTSLDLLLADSAEVARPLAAALDRTNQERQRITEYCLQDARARVLAEQLDERVIVVGSLNYPRGVVGLVAGRLADELGRPAFVYEEGPEVSKGSVRSGVPAFNVVAALGSATDVLVQFGGHAAAAGFTVETRRIAELRDRLRAYADRELAEADLRPVLKADAEVRLDQLSWDVKRQLDLLAPFGFGNPSPLLVSRRCIVKDARIVGTNHLRLNLHDAAGNVWQAIAFRQADRLGDVRYPIDLAYELDVNTWNGRTSLQLVVRDLRPAE